MRLKNIASFHVDPQQGFSPLCPLELPIKGADEQSLVTELLLNDTIAGLRILSKDSHPDFALWNADKHHSPLESLEKPCHDVDVYWPKHCVVGTVGNQLLPGLPHPREYDFVVYKGCEHDMHPYGACYHDLSENQSTGVIEFLQSRKIHTVILGGLALDFCVSRTALQLKGAEFEVIINLAATRAVNPDDERILDSLRYQDVVVCKNFSEISKLINQGRIS